VETESMLDIEEGIVLPFLDVLSADKLKCILGIIGRTFIDAICSSHAFMALRILSAVSTNERCLVSSA